MKHKWRSKRLHSFTRDSLNNDYCATKAIPTQVGLWHKWKSKHVQEISDVLRLHIQEFFMKFEHNCRRSKQWEQLRRLLGSILQQTSVSWLCLVCALAESMRPKVTVISGELEATLQGREWGAADSMIPDVESKAFVWTSSTQNVQILSHPLMTEQASLLILIQDNHLHVLFQQKQKQRKVPKTWMFKYREQPHHKAWTTKQHHAYKEFQCFIQVEKLEFPRAEIPRSCVHLLPIKRKNTKEFGSIHYTIAVISCCREACLFMKVPGSVRDLPHKKKKNKLSDA